MTNDQALTMLLTPAGECCTALVMYLSAAFVVFTTLAVIAVLWPEKTEVR